MHNEFILTVADVELYDFNGELVLTSETMIDDTITQSVNNQEIRAGEFAQLLLDYSFEKSLEVTLNDAQFQAQFLAFNNGTSFQNAVKNAYEKQAVTLDGSGNGTLVETPVGNIHVRRDSGAIQTITPTGSNFTVPGAIDEPVDVRYRTAKNVDFMNIGASEFPSTYKLVMRAKMFSEEQGQGTPIGTFTVEIPNWKVMGNYDITFNTGSPVTSNLTGKALVFRDPDTQEDVYGTYFIDRTSNAPGTQIVEIFSTPDTATLDLSDGDTVQIQTIGFRGNAQPTMTNPTGVAYASDDTGIATVSSSGLVSAAGAGEAIITVTFNNGAVDLTDTTAITVVA